MTPGVLLLADGRFPAGGHANSAGTESAIRYGIVTDVASLARFVGERLATTGRVEAAFAAEACRGAAGLDEELDARLAAPRARAISRQLGRQLLRAAHAVWPACPTGDHHQAVALGLACRAAGGCPDDAAALARHHLAGAICTAAVRMLGLDPAAVSAVQAEAVAAACLAPAPGELPALTTTLTEILAEDHGRWDARLFVA